MEDYNSSVLSNYIDISEINAPHGVFLVKHKDGGKFYVKKILPVYNLDIYHYLQDHPSEHVPKIFEICKDDRDHLIVIEEYVSGYSLEELLNAGTRFTVSQISDYTAQLCDALEPLHNACPPVIHRDIKPSNIILDPHGRIILLDFNAAKHSSDKKPQDTVMMGTQGYAAPEQYGFGSSDARTDIYAVGIVMRTLLETILPPDDKQNAELRRIIEKCTQMDPQRRYGSVSGLRDAIIGAKAGSARHEFLPPGFRTLHPVHMAAALLGYSAILSIGLASRFRNATPVQSAFDKAGIIIVMLLVVFATFDYMGIQEKVMPLRCRSSSILRVLGIVILDVAIFLGGIILMVIIQSIFSV